MEAAVAVVPLVVDVVVVDVVVVDVVVVVGHGSVVVVVVVVVGTGEFLIVVTVVVGLAEAAAGGTEETGEEVVVEATVVDVVVVDVVVVDVVVVVRGASRRPGEMAELLLGAATIRQDRPMFDAANHTTSPAMAMATPTVVRATAGRRGAGGAGESRLMGG